MHFTEEQIASGLENMQMTWCREKETFVNLKMLSKEYQAKVKRMKAEVEAKVQAEIGRQQLEDAHTALRLNGEPLTLMHIKEAVCERFKITDKEFRAKTKFQKYVQARHIYFYLARKFTTHSFPMIAKMLQMDHSTVCHGAKKVELRFDEYAEDIRIIRTRLGV